MLDACLLLLQERHLVLLRRIKNRPAANKKNYKVFLGWTPCFFWKGRWVTQRHDVIYGRESKTMCCAFHSIYQHNLHTISSWFSQAAANYNINDWGYTTASGEEGNAQKSTREIFKGGKQAVEELPNATDDPSAQNKCRRKRPNNGDGQNHKRLCSQSHYHVSDTKLLRWLFIWLLFILVMIESWFLHLLREGHRKMIWTMLPGLQVAHSFLPCDN